jgi:hypothetical protein
MGVRVIKFWMEWFMSLVGTSRENRDRGDAKHVLIVFVAVVNLLFVCSLPPRIPHALGHSNVVAQAGHGNKQYFDHEDLRWAPPPSSPLAVPSLTALSRPIAATEPFIETVTNRLPYNRPPPLA